MQFTSELGPASAGRSTLRKSQNRVRLYEPSCYLLPPFGAGLSLTSCSSGAPLDATRRPARCATTGSSCGGNWLTERFSLRSSCSQVDPVLREQAIEQYSESPGD